MPSTITIGQRFGKLQVAAIGEPEIRKDGRLLNRWLCLCDCGGSKNVQPCHLRKGVVKSCGCLWRAFRLRGDEASFRQLFTQYRVNARARGHSFSLTPESVRAFTSANCFYCGSPPSIPYRARGGKNKPAPYIFNGIDRIDNARGYLEGNCVPCCKLCNYMKRELSTDDFLAHVSRIVMYKGVRHS